MLRRLLHSFLNPKAVVLMYHRVAAEERDIWDLAVSPSNFEAQLQVLQKTESVIPLSELTERISEKKLRRRYIAITFDDGYLDNYAAARPLLEHYQLPATFFITSNQLGKGREFWWDELEHLLLCSPTLPATISMQVGGATVAASLQGEERLTHALRAKHCAWKACQEAPPTKRSALYLQLWQLLRGLPYAAQQQQLQRLKQWVHADGPARPAYASMSVAQLQELASHPLFDIGAHTVSHPALDQHSLQVQRAEMEENKLFLKKATGKEIRLLAYPYGSHNEDSLLAAESASFEAAFTTEEKTVSGRTHRYKMGRFQVRNMPAPEFRAWLSKWQQTT